MGTGTSERSAPGRGGTRERILDHAEALFAERGYRGASLSEIADRVGIRGPSLFSHFAAKRALYEAVLERLLTPFFGLLEELARMPDDAERAGRALARMMEHHAERPRLACLIQQAVLEGGEELELLIDRWYRPFFASIPELLGRDGDDAPGPTIDGEWASVVMAFNSAILGYVTLAPLHERLLGERPLDPEPLQRHIALLCRMVGAIRARPASGEPGPG